MNNNNAPRRRNIYTGQHKPADAPGASRPAGAPADNNGNKVIRILRQINPIEAARRKKEKKLITIFAVAIILVLAVIIALISRSCGISENKDDFIVVMESKATVPYTDTVRNGTVYLNATALAYFCEMTVSGSYSELKLSSDSGAYAVFVPGSDAADVNGTTLIMSAPAVLDESELWLPCDFISSTFVGITVTVDRDINKITVERGKLEGSTEEKPLYASITFTVANLPVVSEDKIRKQIDAYVFKTDISAYEKYLDPTDDSRYLLLVNKTNALGSDYVPSHLISINTSVTLYGGDIQSDETVEKALEAMFAEMRAAGYSDIFISSGYRSYTKQSVLFNTYVSKEMDADKTLTMAKAIEKVKKYSAVAGTSEHQSGLCVDLISSSMTDLDLTFAQNPAFKWLTENAYKFGFILRYPESKVTTTGYNYEPWHYRFVGQYHAAAMRQSGMCLEEYIYSLNHTD
jgi:D-alanyl-D-alanine carboxypeptidase